MTTGIMSSGFGARKEIENRSGDVRDSTTVSGEQLFLRIEAKRRRAARVPKTKANKAARVHLGPDASHIQPNPVESLSSSHIQRLALSVVETP